MFRGASAINLDTKGRIAIPVRYREPLQLEHQGRIVITVDIQSACLLLYPIHEWELIEAKLWIGKGNQCQKKEEKHADKECAFGR